MQNVARELGLIVALLGNTRRNSWSFQHAATLKRVTENHNLRRVAIAILSYLHDHPLAKDCVRGIAKWWVGEELNVVEKALALLVKEGMIEKKRHLYQLAPAEASPHDRASIDKTLRRLRRKR
jgi:hypothetical protein